jgi:hypothetical protein
LKEDLEMSKNKYTPGAIDRMFDKPKPILFDPSDSKPRANPPQPKLQDTQPTRHQTFAGSFFNSLPNPSPPTQFLPLTTPITYELEPILTV